MAPITPRQYMTELGLQKDSEESWVLAAVAPIVQLALVVRVMVAELPFRQHTSPFACDV